MEISHQTTIKVLPQAVKAGLGVLCTRRGKPPWAHVLRGSVPPCHPHSPGSRLEQCRDGNEPQPYRSAALWRLLGCKLQKPPEGAKVVSEDSFRWVCDPISPRPFPLFSHPV